jgi:multidrug efflux pump subunit AcrB
VTRLTLRNPIAVLMACIGVVVFSFVVTPRMGVDTFPDLTPPVLIVATLAPGLGPRDVEKTISWRIEKYASATPGVDHVESSSRNNLSIVYVWMKWGTDLGAAQTLVEAQVNFAMAAVPKSLGVLPPIVLQYDPSNAPVVEVAVTGGLTGAQLYDYAFNNIEPLLEGIPGVASAAVNGGTQRQINVIIDTAKAQGRGINSDDVAQAVSRSNALLPSGEFLAPGFDANVYTNAVARRVRDIGDAAIKGKGNRQVFIKDVAKVEDAGSPPTQKVEVDGRDAVYLNVLRVPGGNTLQIVDAVKDVVRKLHGLPAGMTVTPIFDQSTFVRTTYFGLKQEVIQALVLIALVILVFLQSFRGTLIVSVAIPLSFAITLLVLYASGETLNSFTLGGLTLAMGRLVDDAVVVLESIHRWGKKGCNTFEAALRGTNAVALPVLASTLTTMAVLLPIVLFAGLAKRLFVPLGLTIAVAMMASYVVSIGVTPVACRYLLGHGEPGPLARHVEGWITGLANGYTSLLEKVLPYRMTIMLASLVLVLASGLVAAKLPTTFFPEIDESMETVYVRVAAGTSLADSSRLIRDMAKTAVASLPKGAVTLALTNIGLPNNLRSAMVSPNAAPHMGFIQLQLSDPDERQQSQRQLADMLRKILNDKYPGVEFVQSPGGLVANVFSNGYWAPLVAEVRGDDLNALYKQAQDVIAVARTVPGIRDIYPNLRMDYPEIHIDSDRQEASLVDVSARGAGQTTLDATLGNINLPSVWIDGSNGQSYYVVTSFDPHQVRDVSELKRIPVRVDSNGAAVTLGAYGHVSRSVGPVLIERNGLERAARVQMQTEGRDIGSAAQELEEKLKADPRTRDIPFHFVGEIDLMRTTFGGLGLAVVLAVMVVFMLMASQFKSLRLPFIMLFTIPCTLIGIVLALMAAGQGFSVTALMGVLMVVGIAVSNGILLIDHANVKLGEGLDKTAAILDAARTRFTPIIMTSLATVIGLIPTALALEHGTESNRPLALAVVGGLTSSTILSLFLVPVIFMLIAVRPTPESAEDAAHGMTPAPS